MKSGRLDVWLAVALSSSVVLLPHVAWANPKPLPFSYPWETLSEGQAEVEQYVDIIPLAVTSETGQVVEPRFELQTEIEYGITDRAELGLYLMMKNAPEEEGAGAPLLFDGIKQRLRYRIGDEGTLPVELAVYFELAQKPDELEAEQKLIVQKRFGRLKLVTNLWIEEALERGGELELELHPTLGGAYQFTPNLWTGIEGWMSAPIELEEEEAPAGETADERSVRELNEEPQIFVGPTVSLVWDKLWWSTGGYVRLNSFSRTMLPGDRFGRIFVRTVVGVSL